MNASWRLKIPAAIFFFLKEKLNQSSLHWLGISLESGSKQWGIMESAVSLGGEKSPIHGLKTKIGQGARADGVEGR